MCITLEQALTCEYFHSDHNTQGKPTRRNPEPQCQVWRRNGQTRTWKRAHTPTFVVPVKHGLRFYDQITDYSPVHVLEDCPRLTAEERAEAKQYRIAHAEHARRMDIFRSLIESEYIYWDNSTSLTDAPYRGWRYTHDGSAYTPPTF